MSRLVLFGFGNVLGNILDCALALGHEVTQIVQNVPEVIRPRTKSVDERIAALDPRPRLVQLDAFVPQPGEIYALGTTAHGRTRLVDALETRFGIRLATLIHPTSYVSSLTRVGDGVFVGALAALQAYSVIGDHVHVGTSVTIGHDSVIEPYVCLRQSSNIAGCSVIGRGTVVNLNASVLPELVIGPDAVIGAGAVVIRDVEARAVMAGVPARVLRVQPPAAPD